MHWNNGWDNNSGPWWLIMAVMMLAIWGGLVWLIVTLIRHRNAPPHNPSAAPPAERVNPEDLLHERLARGDIDVDEYHQRVDALRAKRTE